MKPSAYLRIVGLGTLATFLAPLSTQAAALEWDGAASGAPSGGTGTWDTNTTANWWNGTADVAWPALGGTNDDAVFGGTAGTVTLDAAGITANDLTFNTTGYILSGAATLTLNGTTPTLTSVTGVSTTIGDNTATVLAGSTGLVKAGAGTLTLNPTAAATLTGTELVRDGTLALDFSNMATPTNLVPSTAVLTFSPTGPASKVIVKGNATGATAQTIATINAGRGTSVLLADPPAGTTLAINCNSVVLGGSYRGFNGTQSLVVGVPTSAQESLVAFNDTSSTTIDYSGYCPVSLLWTSDGGATVDFCARSSNKIVRGTASSVISGNYTGGTSGSQVKVTTTGPGQSLNLNGLDLESNAGVLFVGADDYRVYGGTVGATVPGTGTGNTRWTNIACWGTGVLTLDNCNIAGGNNQNAGFSKHGPGTLVVMGGCTYPAATNINSGVMAVDTLANAGLGTGRTITTTTGSNIATVSNVTGLAVGMTVFSANLPYKTSLTTITAIDEATLTLTLSQNATATASGTAIWSVGFAGGIGLSTNAAGNLVLGGGTLRYTGNATSTDRLFTLAASSGLDASGSTAVDSGAITWSNTGTYATSATGPRTLTLTGTNPGDNTLAGIIPDNAASPNNTSLAKSGVGKWILTAVSTYSGATTISGGTLALGGSASINNSTLLAIGAGGTFDVSTHASYTLSTNTALKAAGTGASAATINGAASGSVDLGSQPISLTYTSGAPLTIAQAALTLNNNAFTVVVPGTALGNGTYTLISTSSPISGTVNATPSYAGGNGLASGATGVVSISGNNVVLTVSGGTASPYSSWAGGHAFDAPNGEGMAYGMAWMLGAPTDSSPAIDLLPEVLSATGGFVNMQFSRVLDVGPAHLYLEYSDDLANWTPVEVPIPATPPATVTASGINFDVAIAGGLYGITAHVPSGITGRKFVRLSATEN